MTPDTVVKLGDFEFSGVEVPERIAFGGTQKLVTHELVGGVRVIDAMGGFESLREWSGWFRGPDALARAEKLNTMRRAGKSLTLTWSEQSYEVVIESFEADFQRRYQIPYRICCAVVRDAKAADTTDQAPTLDAMCRRDAASINAIAGTIGDSTLSSLTSTLSGAIGAVSSFAQATTAQINSVLAPLAAVQAQVTTLIGSAGNAISGALTFGGVLPNLPLAQNVSRLTSQIASVTSLPPLLNLQSTASRLALNLNSQVPGVASQTVAGTNLFSMASQAYGDATAWSTLAQANNIVDPMIQGIRQISIPAAPLGIVGGIFGSQ